MPGRGGVGSVVVIMMVAMAMAMAMEEYSEACSQTFSTQRHALRCVVNQTNTCVTVPQVCRRSGSKGEMQADRNRFHPGGGRQPTQVSEGDGKPRGRVGS